MRSTTYDKLHHVYSMYRRAGGYIRTRELLEEGFTNRQIALLTEEHYLEKVCRGCYWMARCGQEKPFDYKCIEVSLSNPRAVIAMESACYYQGVIEEEPELLTVATERTDRSTMKMNFPVKRRYFSSSNFSLGVKRVHRAMGSYNIYDPERSLCDIVRLEGETAGRMFLEELFDTMQAKEKHYERMLRYAELLKVKLLL